MVPQTVATAGHETSKHQSAAQLFAPGAVQESSDSACLLGLNALCWQVAVEFVGPALLVLAWSTLLLGSWVSGLTQAQRAGRSDAAEQQSVWAAAALWEFVGGFMAWWTCACWASSSLLTVLLHRLGFLVA